MKIDAHQHFWQYDPIRDSWISDEMKVIKRDFMPEDLFPNLEKEGIDGCVAVQADQSEKETEFLLNLAKQHPWIKGVVGWVDLLDSQLDSRLEFYSENSKFKGVRHILQAEKAGYMTNEKFVNGIKSLSKWNLTYDILTTESQLTEVVELLKKLPEMHLVIDHLSKPNIKEKSFAQWRAQMKEVSQFEHVNVKLSGMVTEADWSSWKPEDFEPYVDTCLEYFGPKRLMYGSDWPVSLLAGEYGAICESLKHCISRLSSDEQSQIMGLTAANFYDLD